MAKQEMDDLNNNMDSLSHDEDESDERFDDVEEEEVDEAAHEKLLNSLFALDGKKRKKNEVRGISATSGNLDLVVHAKKDESKIKPKDLNLKGRDASANLKKPLNSLETEMAKRHVARETIKTEMTTWEPVVQEIRAAPQIIFSERPRGVEMKKALQPKGFKPRTPLEKELFAALGQSEDIINPNKELTKAEERALKAMSVQEAMERRAELMKHHELLSRAQVRAKRVKKIKSKRYRKILRKEREGAEKKELERLKEEDPEAFVERLEQLEKDRMEERLTLKHRGGGKFARLHKVYSKFDDKTRDAMQNMLQKSRELTRKTGTISSSDEEEQEEEVVVRDATAVRGLNDDDDNNTETQERARATRLQMLKAINKKAGGWLDGPNSMFVYCTSTPPSGQEDSEVEQQGDHVSPAGGEALPLDEQSVSEDPAESSSTIVERQGKRKAAEMEESDDDDNNEETLTSKITVKSSTVVGQRREKRKAEEMEEENGEDDEKVSEKTIDETSSPAAVEETKKKKKRKKGKKKKMGGEDGDEEKIKEKPVVETTLETSDPAVDNEEEDGDDGDGALRVTMEELFQDEDVVEEFARDKAAVEEKARPKVEDTRLPGWGCWAGPDYKGERPKSKKQKRAEARIAQQEKERKKVQQPHVWLNPNTDDAIRKLQPKMVPFPFKSVQQYEASLRQPVSRGFVRETAFKLLTKPEVVTKLGHIIKPLDKEDIFKKKAEEAAQLKGGPKASATTETQAGHHGNKSNKVRGGAGKRKNKQKRRGIS